MPMSFISTEATREEQAEKEAEEFDMDLAYIFGSQARYKADVSSTTLLSALTSS